MNLDPVSRNLPRSFDGVRNATSISIAIGTCRAYYQNTLPRLLPSLLAAGAQPSQILAVASDVPEAFEFLGVPVLPATTNSLGLSGHDHRCPSCGLRGRIPRHIRMERPSVVVLHLTPPCERWAQ
jgi:hypothetical protein